MSDGDFARRTVEALDDAGVQPGTHFRLNPDHIKRFRDQVWRRGHPLDGAIAQAPRVDLLTLWGVPVLADDSVTHGDFEIAVTPPRLETQTL